MANEQPKWKSINMGEILPCQSFLRKKDGEILKLSTIGGVEVGQDCYYLPVDEVINVIKDYPVEVNEDEEIMKELSIEQKAKHYDDAIKRLEDVMTGKCQKTFMFTKGLFDYIFPELKKNEENVEDNIRKALIEMVNDTVGDSLWVDYNVHKEDAIAWLEKQGEKELVTCPICGSKFEKQGEQNPQIKLVFPKFRVGDIIQHIPLEKWDTTKKIVHIDETGYYFNLSHQGDTVSGGFIGFSLENDYELVKQNPAMIQWKGDNLKEVIDFTGVYKEGFEKWFHNSWEEYEKYVHEHNNIFKIFNEDGSHIEVPVGAWIIKAPDGYNTASKFAISPILTELSIESNFKFKKAIECIENYVNSFPHSQKPEIWQHINFLKSLKPQPKQEWSDEDEKKRLAIIAHLDIQASNYCINREKYSNGYKLDALIDWLKSLRPQSTWKPSEEHLDVLNNMKFAVQHFGPSASLAALDDLYNQLKKLTE